MSRAIKSVLFPVIFAAIVIFSLLPAGCSTSVPEPILASNSVLSGTITESGSTTVQPLAEKLAGAFMSAHPGIKVIIQGGGTSVGIKAAFDGTVDFGGASRELTSNDPQLVSHLLARDGIALIVNPVNPVNNLTKAQVKNIYAGHITNWSQLGGIDKEIHISAREEGSGTRAAFDELIWVKTPEWRKKLSCNPLTELYYR
jgi:phosphate transport system substrate-binding protein